MVDKRMMIECVQLLEAVRNVIPENPGIPVERVQSFLTSRLSLGIVELTRDYANHKNTLSTRARAVMARTVFEGSTRILSALKSGELALSIYHASNKEDLKRCRQLDEVEPAPDGSYDRVRVMIEDKLKSVEESFPNFKPRKLSAFSLAKESGFERHYRALYFELSRYVHHNPHAISDDDDPSFAKELEVFVVTACCAAAEGIARHYQHPATAQIVREAHALVDWAEGNCA